MPSRPPTRKEVAPRSGSPVAAPATLPTGTTGEDLFLTGSAHWERYKLAFVAAIALVVLGLLGVQFYRANQRKADEAASAELNSAKTVQDYQNIIDKHPGTLAAANAYLLLGRLQADARDFAGAEASWQTMSEKFPKSPLTASALLGRAAALESEGKIEDARKAYAAVATGYPNDFAAPMARLGEAEILKAQRKSEDARHAFENIMATFPKTAAARIAEQELHYLPALPPLNAPPPPPPLPSATPASSPLTGFAPAPNFSLKPQIPVASKPSEIPAASPAAAAVAPTPAASPAP